MNTGVEHPLAVFLAAPAVPVVEPHEELPYDPVAQLQVRWKDIPDYMDIVCSGKHTGDPSTRMPPQHVGFRQIEIPTTTPMILELDEC